MRELLLLQIVNVWPTAASRTTQSLIFQLGLESVATWSWPTFTLMNRAEVISLNRNNGNAGEPSGNWCRGPSTRDVSAELWGYYYYQHIRTVEFGLRRGRTDRNMEEVRSVCHWEEHGDILPHKHLGVDITTNHEHSALLVAGKWFAMP